MITRFLCFTFAFSLAVGCKKSSSGSKNPAPASDSNTATSNQDPTPTPTPTGTEIKTGPDASVTGGKGTKGREFCRAFVYGKDIVGENNIKALAGNTYFAAITPVGVKALVPDPNSYSTNNAVVGFTSILIPNENVKTNCDPTVVDTQFAYVTLEDTPVYAEKTFATQLCTLLKGTDFANDSTAFQYTALESAPGSNTGWVEILAPDDNMPLACRGKNVYTKRQIVVRTNLKF